VKDQQEVFLEKDEVEELESVCGCPNQKDIGQHTAYEIKIAANFPYLFHDPVAEYMSLFLSQQQRLFQQHVSSSLYENFHGAFSFQFIFFSIIKALDPTPKCYPGSIEVLNSPR